jgi:hypothetical protein
MPLRWLKRKPINKFVQIFLLLSGSIIVALACAELAVRGFGWLKEERAMSAHVESDGSDRILRWQINPYLGWSGLPGAKDRPDHVMLNRYFNDGLPEDQPWERISVNALGFFSEYPDYRDLHDDRVVVGIFGGSVADYFANTMQKRLAKRLSVILRIPEERIAVISLATGGYKQPQQVLALTYAKMLGIRFNILINIDGFNEIALGGTDCGKGHHPVFPSRELFTTITGFSSGRATLWSLRTTLRVAELKANARDLLLMTQTNFWIQQSELARAVAGLWVQRNLRKADVLERRLQERFAAEVSSDGIVPDLADRRLGSPEGCWELVAELWARGSRLMADHARRINARYVHILQPNQYVPGSKPLSEAERGYAFQPDHAWSKNAAGGYRYLQDQGDLLLREGIAFHDFTAIFKDQQAPIYIDTCCHINNKGNEILLDAIVGALDKKASTN